MNKSDIIPGRFYWCGDGIDRAAVIGRVMAIADDGVVVRRSWGDCGLIGFDKVLAEHNVFSWFGFNKGVTCKKSDQSTVCH